MGRALFADMLEAFLEDVLNMFVSERVINFLAAFIVLDKVGKTQRP